MPPARVTAGSSVVTGSKTGREMRFAVSFTPDTKEFVRRFDRFASDLTDNTEIWDAMADTLEDEVAKSFQTEGTHTGARWHPLSRRYAMVKARRFPGKRILEATGRLRQSFKRGGRDHVRSIRPRRMVWGSSVQYFSYHQEGTRRMPRRPILRLRSAQKDEWQRMIHDHLLERARGRLTGRKAMS